MANNFRITGVTNPYYISKDGDDLGLGLNDPDDPKATLARYGDNHIVGSGQYKGAFSLFSAGNTSSWYFDGVSKILCTGDLLLGAASNNQTQNLNSLTLGSFLFIDLAGFVLRSGTGSGSNNFYRCIIENGSLANLQNSRAVVDSSVFNNITGPLVSNLLTINKSLVFNSAITLPGTNITTLKNSYADAATVFTMSSYFSAPASQFFNCNIQGQFNVGGVLYELKQERDGTPIDPNPAIADIIAIDPTIYTRGNFSESPNFENISKRDFFSVQNSSPNLFGADDGSSIGAVRIAGIIKVGVNNATVSNLLTSSGDYVYDTGSGSGFGTATFDVVQIAPIPQVLGRVDIAQLLNFDSLEAIGSSENTDVVIVDNFAPSTAGANPRRLTYEMRWSTQETAPANDSEYDNGGIVTAGNYSKFEHFEEPKIDISNLGNGDPSFNPVGAVNIQAKWVQIRVTVREGIG